MSFIGEGPDCQQKKNDSSMFSGIIRKKRRRDIPSEDTREEKHRPCRREKDVAPVPGRDVWQTDMRLRRGGRREGRGFLLQMLFFH